jgi:hypothetical protein
VNSTSAWRFRLSPTRMTTANTTPTTAARRPVSGSLSTTADARSPSSAGISETARVAAQRTGWVTSRDVRSLRTVDARDAATVSNACPTWAAGTIPTMTTRRTKRPRTADGAAARTLPSWESRSGLADLVARPHPNNPGSRRLGARDCIEFEPNCSAQATSGNRHHFPLISRAGTAARLIWNRYQRSPKTSAVACIESMATRHLPGMESAHKHQEVLLRAGIEPRTRHKRRAGWGRENSGRTQSGTILRASR